MSITKQEKSTIINTYKKHVSDTGSSEVQVAILTKRINDLGEHMKIHTKDFHSRRGLLAMVAQRRSLLDYLKKTHNTKYLEMIKALGLRR